MSTPEHVAAFTEVQPLSSYGPGYVNVSRLENGLYRVQVRQQSDENGRFQHAHVDVPAAALHLIAVQTEARTRRDLPNYELSSEEDGCATS